MASNALVREFDPTYTQPRRLELDPADIDPSELRRRILGSLTPPWRALNDSDRLHDSSEWFWTACDGAVRNGQTGYVLLHEIGRRLRVTNAVCDVPGGLLSIDEQNTLVKRFQEEVVVPLQLDGVVAIHEKGPEASLSNWIEQPAIDALAQFSLMANKSSGSSNPADSARWNDFLIKALPVKDGTGFAEVLQTVLIGNGWPEDSATELAVQVERANDLLALYRSAQG